MFQESALQLEYARERRKGKRKREREKKLLPGTIK